MPVRVARSDVGPDGLTDRQRDILGAILAAHEAREPMPSVRELMARFGINSPNGLSCHLRALRDKGFIAMAAGKSRSIRVLRRADSAPGPAPDPTARLRAMHRLRRHFAADALGRLGLASADLLARLADELDAASP